MLSIRRSAADFQCAQFRKLLVQFLPNDGRLPLQVPDRRIRWTPRLLAICAILLQLMERVSLADRFELARDAITGMYPTRRRVGGSYAGFVEALKGSGPRLLQVLATHLREVIPVVFRSLWTVDGRLIFAVDGSRFECPRTKANERLGCAGRKKSGPQFMVTTLFHVGTGLIWGWRQGPGKTSERVHLREMLPLLPAGCWLLADAGFTGFDLLCDLQQKGVNFIIRCGANVTLLKKLKYRVRERGDLVYLWPDNAQRRQHKPLVLRLVRLRTGRSEICLLVSELDRRVISERQVLQMYRSRWGVEVLYRSLKQTMGRGRLQSDSPTAAAAELDWAMMSLWMVAVVLLQQMQSVGHEPDELSLAGGLRIIRRAIGVDRRQRRSMRWFAEQLRGAKRDDYQRHSGKASRNYPRKKYEPPPRAPKVRTAWRSEVKLVQRLTTTVWAT